MRALPFSFLSGVFSAANHTARMRLNQPTGARRAENLRVVGKVSRSLRVGCFSFWHRRFAVRSFAVELGHETMMVLSPSAAMPRDGDLFFGLRGNASRLLGQER